MQNKSILFLSPYPYDKAPSQRLKYEQYFPIFKKEGYEVSYKCFISMALWKVLYKKGHIPQKLFFTFIGYLKRYWLLFSIRKFDLVYVHIWGTPFGLPVFEWLLSKICNKLIYDIDDMVHLIDLNEANNFLKFIKGPRKIIFLMKNADHVITCTPKLDEIVRRYNFNTTDISSTVDTELRYHSRNDYETSGQMVLGWSGSYTTSRFLYLLAGVIKKLATKHDFRLVVLGDKDFDIEGVKVEALAWQEKIEIETLKRFDIGLYPLPDEEWVYGKSGLKAIQYMALGIPTIATAIGANFRLIDDGKNGFLVPPEDYSLWEARIEQLLLDQKLRKQLGKKGRNTVHQNYSLEMNKEKYLSIFESLIKIEVL